VSMQQSVRRWRENKVQKERFVKFSAIGIVIVREKCYKC
jgi:hypothetical protein